VWRGSRASRGRRLRRLGHWPRWLVMIMAVALGLGTVLVVLVAPFVLARVATGGKYLPDAEKSELVLWLAMAGLPGLTAGLLFVALWRRASATSHLRP
jgi:hypothetical protein